MGPLQILVLHPQTRTPLMQVGTHIASQGSDLVLGASAEMLVMMVAMERNYSDDDGENE